MHHYSILHSIASDQGTQFVAKEVCQWAHIHGFHWSYHVSYYPEAAGLIEWPFEDLVIVPARWQYLAGLGQGSPRSRLGYKSAPNTWCCFSHGQDSHV